MKISAPYRLAFCLFFFFFIQLLAQAQVGGCTDPAATNFNTAATTNDGSCMYNTTTYSPPIKVNSISDTLIEGSGLQMAGGFLWSFNDGGGAAAIYRVDTTTGFILQTVNIGGATNVDWEDMAFDGTHFYIGDFGNNGNGARTDLKIYKFPLSTIPDYGTNPVVTISSGVEVINFHYSNQTTITPGRSDSTRFDCEALLVKGGKIHLFSKNWIDKVSTHYLINGVSAGTYTADSLETLSTNYLVTGADKNPAGTTVVLLGYQIGGFFNHYMHLLSDFSGGRYFNGNKRRIDLPTALSMGQAEGICFVSNNYGYISNERISSPITVTQKLRRFTTDGFAPAVVLPVSLVQFSAKQWNGGHTLSWKFTEPVQHLKILSSANDIDFDIVKTYATGTEGSFFNQGSSAQVCYKLSWEEDSGSEKLSNTICLQGESKGLQKLVLRRNGELSFVSGEGEVGNYNFRLISSDGRLLAEAKKQVINGANYMRFGKMLNSGSLIFLQTISGKEVKSFLLSVE